MCHLFLQLYFGLSFIISSLNVFIHVQTYVPTYEMMMIIGLLKRISENVCRNWFNIFIKVIDKFLRKSFKLWFIYICMFSYTMYNNINVYTLVNWIKKEKWNITINIWIYTSIFFFVLFQYKYGIYCIWNKLDIWKVRIVVLFVILYCY